MYLDPRDTWQREPTEDPIRIVGAGPAGLACAIVLARSGKQVIISDWHKVPGSRFHGDYQGLENWTADANILDELTASGICITFDISEVSKGYAFDAWGHKYEIESKQPLYYLVRRGDNPATLDRGLLSQAQQLGVVVEFNKRIRDIQGPAVLAAGPRTADIIAAGYVFDTDMTDGNWICFNDSLAPLGYAYLLVHASRGTVASCMFTGFKNQQEYVERTVAFFQDRAGLNMNDPKKFGGYGNIRLPRTAVQGNKLVVGEHAGFQDCLAGFGMTYALRSGILAARSIIEGRDYTQLWQQQLLPLLRTSVCNRYLFTLLGDRGRRWVLEKLIAGKDARRLLRRIYRSSLLAYPIWPLALRRYRTLLKDVSCDHVECSCVWCEHGGSTVPNAFFD